MYLHVRDFEQRGLIRCQRITIPREVIKIARECITIQYQGVLLGSGRVALRRNRVPLARKRIPLHRHGMAVGGERIPLPHERSELHAESISNPVGPSRDSHSHSKGDRRIGRVAASSPLPASRGEIELALEESEHRVFRARANASSCFRVGRTRRSALPGRE